MNKTEKQTKEQEVATLLIRVRRQPPSLANYHYHIEPGKRVYIHNRYTNQSGIECATVATMPDADCASEDYFRVRLSSLQFA